MTNKSINLIPLVVWLLFLPVSANALPLVKNNMPRCDFKMPSEGPSIEIRGTGYFWGEYITRGLPDNKQLMLLIQSEAPSYDFRGKTKSAKFNCDEQTIINYLWIDPPPNKPYIDSLDCHILDDMRYQIGEAVFGYVKSNSVGLHRATESWQILLSGKGGTIKKVHESLRVYCTVLPGNFDVGGN